MGSPVRRRSALVGLWVAGTALAVVVGVAAIGLAGARVTDRTTMVRAGDHTMATLLDPVVIDASTLPPETTTTVAGSGAAPTTSPAPSAATGHDSSGGGGPEAPPSQAPSASEPSDAVPAPVPTTAPSTTAPPSPSSTKSTVVVGGTVKVQCIGSSVSLVSAVPKAGFSVDVGNRGPDQVEVEFRSSTHQSQVQAQCRAGVITFNNEESAGGA